MKQLHYKDYREKLKGCFIGKAVGGTLGMPYEGRIGIRPVDYYDPVPTEMTENDDLDLQVVWLSVIRECGLPVNRYDLANGWKNHVRVTCDEYATCMRNLSGGVYAPLSGGFDTKFTDGMGAAIRTEVWAGLAPGDPALAVRLAMEDACVDHHGDGMYAAMFLAAVESAAYLESDTDKLLQIGLSYIPKKSRLATALRYTIDQCAKSDEPFAIHEKILSHYFVQNWTDVTLNLCLIVTAWLCGKGDFSRCICLAAELGQDADCTCATLGSILGIINPNGFESRWTDPIGESLVLSANIANMHEASTIGAFCHQIAEICMDVLQYYHSDVVLTDAPFFTKTYVGPFMTDEKDFPALNEEAEETEAVIAMRPLIVRLSYPEKIALGRGESAVYTLKVTDPTHQLKSCGLQLTGCDSLVFTPRCQILTFDEKHQASCEVQVTVVADRPRRPAIHPLTFRFEVNGMRFDVTAGLPTNYEFYRVPMEVCPEHCPDLSVFQEAQVDKAEKHYRKVPQGGYLYTVEFRHPVQVRDAMITVTGTRAMKAWIDEDVILEHDSCEYVPALHRTDNVADFSMDGNWHRLTVWVAPASVPNEPSFEERNNTENLSLRAQRFMYDKKNLIDEDEGELFVYIGSRRGYMYLHEMEWRLPTI